MLDSCHTSPYGGHHGGERMAQKVLQLRIFLPTLFRDATKYMKKYDQCQRMGTISRIYSLAMSPG